MMDGNEQEWAVAFHGFRCPEFVLPKIINEGPRVGFRNVYGKGIYCSPKIEVAERYAESLEFGDKKFCMIL